MTIETGIAKNGIADTANETVKFEVGKTYYGVDFGGEWSEDAPVTVKTLRVIKRTAKTFTAIDESGNQVSKRISLAYAGTKEVVTVPSVNDITVQSVNVYSDKEFTPAIAAAPTGNYKAWLAVVEADNNVETEPATVEEKADTKAEAETEDEDEDEVNTDEEYTEDELQAGIEDAPVDDFVAKLAELKAEQDAAKAVELGAKKAFTAASAEYEKHRAATQAFLDEHADKLTEKLTAIEIDRYIKVVNANADDCYDVFSTSELNVYAFNGFGEMFLMRYRGNVLGTYDTPAQVDAVIGRLKAAIESGATEFTFPTVDQLAEPAIVEEIVTIEPAAEEAPAKFVVGQCYRNMNWLTYEHGDKVYKIAKRTAKYVYIATYSKYYGEWVGGDDKETDRYYVRENDGGEYVEYWDGQRICAKFNDEQITKSTADSLTRAMKIALDCYKGFCIVGNLTAAEYELKLYNICRKAKSELGKEMAA